MKRMIVILLSMISLGAGAQKNWTTNYLDDGLVSKYLTIDGSKDSINSYMASLTAAITSAQKAHINNRDEMVAYLKYDPNSIPPLEQALAYVRGCRDCTITENFISDLIDIKNNTGNEYKGLEQIRGGLARIASKGQLNSSEAKALVLIDLTLQAQAQSFALNDPGAKLPRWFTCAVGVIFNGIIGGATGLLTGVHIGVLVAGPTGAALGGIIGGLVGVAGGVVVGIIAGCDS